MEDDDNCCGGGGARVEVEAVKRVGVISMVANGYGGGGGREGIAGECY